MRRKVTFIKLKFFRLKEESNDKNNPNVTCYQRRGRVTVWWGGGMVTLIKDWKMLF